MHKFDAGGRGVHGNLGQKNKNNVRRAMPKNIDAYTDSLKIYKFKRIKNQAKNESLWWCGGWVNQI